MPLTNFAPKHPDVIEPFGTLPGQTMHWFGLTDSTYWLELGDFNPYEYAPF